MIITQFNTKTEKCFAKQKLFVINFFRHPLHSTISRQTLANQTKNNVYNFPFFFCEISKFLGKISQDEIKDPKLIKLLIARCKWHETGGRILRQIYCASIWSVYWALRLQTNQKYMYLPIVWMCAHVCIVTGTCRPFLRSARLQYTFNDVGGGVLSFRRELYCSCISHKKCNIKMCNQNIWSMTIFFHV